MDKWFKQFQVTTMLALSLFSLPLMAQAQPSDGVSAETLADPEGQFMEIDGARIYYIEQGPVDGPAVLLLHGFGGSTFTWRDNIVPLADAGYRVVAFDRPPYGLSSKDPSLDFTTEAYAELTASLMDALGIERATVIGHSAGGGVAAQFALDYPQRLDVLVLVAGAVGEMTQGGTGFEALSGLLSAIDPASPLAQNLVSTLITPERFVDILRGAYHESYTLTETVVEGYQRPLQVEGWEAGFLALLSEGQPTAVRVRQLRQVEVPTLLIWGEADTWVPLSIGRRLNDTLPNARLIYYTETGHLPMEENTEQFNEDLLEFLDRVYD